MLLFPTLPKKITKIADEAATLKTVITDNAPAPGARYPGMPSNHSNNKTIEDPPVMMIGEKAADMILGNPPLEAEHVDYYVHKKEP